MTKVEYITPKQAPTKTLVELTKHYNSIAEIIGEKIYKKFKDKPTAVSRVCDIQLKHKAFINKQTKKTTTKYDNTNIVTYTKDCKAFIKNDSAMALIQNYVKRFKKGTTIEKAIDYFYTNWKCPRSKQKVDIAFSRGYVVGAIREGYIKLK